MTTVPSPPVATCARPSANSRRLVPAFFVLWSILLSAAGTKADESPAIAPLRVAVYDVPPYGSVGPDGSVDGVSVDLWRRAAEMIGRDYRLVPVHEMEAILAGLERKDYDAAIGAITITPGRLARVDFSYPAHRSGVAVVVRRDSGPLAAFLNYGAGGRALLACRNGGGDRSDKVRNRPQSVLPPSYIPGICMISTISTHAPGICRCGWFLPNIFAAASAESACTIE